MEWLDPLALARWQFGLTTVYHYLFVPLTIGMALAAAIFQTAWVRTAKVHYLHLTRFFGKIFLINFAMGVVTGIVQEFQFGMNWSDYSRFVGDVFGAPLAFEGLLAFFFEATFIGVWIFGWDKMPRKLHLMSIWFVAIGSIMSAYFIIAANAFMQNPVGYEYNPATNRAELVDFWALLTNPVALAAFPHTIFGAFMFAAGVIISVSAWHLYRGQHLETMHVSLKFGLWAMLVSTAGVALTGDQLGLAMYAAQPMKMAAAEATFDTVCGADASFSLFTLGTPDGSSELFSIRVPYLLSLLSTHTLDACVHGINDLNAEYAVQFADLGIDNFAPVLWITYWSFRWMIGLGMLHAFIALVGLWVTRKNAKKPVAKWMWKIAIWSYPLALFANIVGWVFTEMGRQPWIVFGLMSTRDGVSPGTSGLEVLISLIAFTAIYAALAVVEIRLIVKAAQKGPDTTETHDEAAPAPSVVY
ncbi:cytochrome ubiquinol oxidase subunit I [Microbacterium aerolatum]|uniref:Cytochrome ubiquinol oxidase subunit I n=1 Tax=Microbacterium aerolatum TaxID=153731 RepID=A0A511AEV2_9MICO|nr:cytochrome ubiquinol oxidase subunit I [Microbacterium aerolatum]GEK86684.1 cytochrome ubiquinol oxidase subunit I [Microbacterium aerolatum]GGB18878.1 cytochrome ubiquinol oxidase subunit I [Microbacterium aerolatum]